ncbi:MAG: extracellular solute-binding protein [Bacillota bacterium]|jgi:multiple sugar transport system substrate-binding protein
MKRIPALWVGLVLLAALLPACSLQTGLEPRQPITLNLWHNFGGQMQAAMDGLLQDFNSTLGMEKGIIVNVTSVASSASLQAKLAMIAAGDPGAPQMPDIATCYPATAALLSAKGLLTPLDDHLTDQELAAYLPEFVEEGRLSDGQLYVFPFAKSTEVLILNRTLFEPFAAAVGVDIESLSTFEGVAEVAQRYFQWSGGKEFLAVDSIFNLFQLGMEQLGENLIDEGKLNTESPAFRRIWNTTLEPTLRGGCAIYPGYSSDLAKTGDVVCSLGSTAGILFYGDEIILPDNTRVPVEYSVLPYPVFSEGKSIAIQRGGGLVVARSTPAKEAAAATFLKWFTSPEQNMRFVADTGYLPVTHSAFAHHLEREARENRNPNIRRLLETAMHMHEEYSFFTPTPFDGLNALAERFKTNFLILAEQGRAEYVLSSADRVTAYERASAGLLEEFVASLR